MSSWVDVVSGREGKSGVMGRCWVRGHVRGGYCVERQWCHDGQASDAGGVKERQDVIG